MITHTWKKYFHFLVSIGQQFIEKGKIQIEVGKLRWELKKKYQVLGKYVTHKKESQSVLNFSHDQEYLQKISNPSEL